MFLPGIGGIVYAFMVLLPDLRERSRHHAPRVLDALQPGRELTRLSGEWEATPTPHNRLMLARELLRLERWEEAGVHLEVLVRGYFREDPSVRELLGRCRFHSGDWEGAGELLASLEDKGGIAGPVHHAMIAYSAGRLGDPDQARQELEKIFRLSGNLECGWILARSQSDGGLRQDLAATIAAMETQIRRHKDKKRSMDTRWLDRARRL